MLPIYKSESLLIITSQNTLIRLKTPFKVLCLQDVDVYLKANQQYTVIKVFGRIENGNELSYYLSENKIAFPYFYFEVLVIHS